MTRFRAAAPIRFILTAAIGMSVLAAAGWLIYTVARPLVSVTDPIEGPVIQAFYSTGTIQPEREFPIKSNVPGTILRLPIDKGSHVRAGDEIAFVSDPERELMLRKCLAELSEKRQLAEPSTSPVLREFDAKISAMESLLAIAQREQDRVRSLMERSAGSQTDLDRSMDRVKTLWSELESFKAQKATRQLALRKDVDVAVATADIAQFNVGEQVIKSPVDGVVLDRPISLGTRVAVNDQITLIADVRPEKLVMRAAVDEEDIDKVHDAQFVKMTLYSFPGKVFEGKVVKVYDRADSARRTFEVDVQLIEVNPRLAAGMTGELAFVMARKDNATVVPAQALQGDAIWVVRSGKLAKATTNVGLRSVERVELIDPLQPGDKVVISPVLGMEEGRSIRTKQIDPITAAGLNKPKEAAGNFKGF